MSSWLFKKKKKKSKEFHEKTHTIIDDSNAPLGTSLRNVEYENADIAYRIAYQTMLLPDIFAYLDCLIIEENLSKANAVEQHKKATSTDELAKKQQILYKRIQKFLSLILQYRKMQQSKNYIILFHEYMSTIKEQSQKDIFHYHEHAEHSTICGYIQMITFYVEHKDVEFSSTTNMNDAIQVIDDHYNEARLLLSYLEEHTIDPYSCLVGLSPSRELLKCTLNEKKSISSYTEVVAPSRLYEAVIKWSNSNIPIEEVMNQIKHYGTLLRGVHTLKKGDIVLLEMSKYVAEGSLRESSKKAYQIVRYTGSARFDYQQLDVYLTLRDDAKKKVTTVSSEDIFVFPNYIKKTLTDEHFFNYEKYVESPILICQAKMVTWIATRTQSFLDANDIHYSMLYKAMASQCSIMDLPELKRGYATLKSLQIPHDLLEECQRHYNEGVNEFLRCMSDDMIFVPKRELEIDSLKEFPCDSIVKKEINKYVGMFDYSIDQIEFQRRELISGVRKQKLVDWWLSTIKESLYKTLSSLDFYPNAISENYIIEPPADLKKVASNFKLLREILDSESSACAAINETIEKIKVTVYEQIDTFLMDAIASVLEFLKLPCTIDDIKNFNVDKTTTYFMEHPEFNHPQPVLWVKELLQDIKYLNTMKRLESVECSPEERMEAFHIVPISGLAYGMICRLENETKTVIELWAPMAYMRKCTAEDNSFRLHRAISLLDFEEIDSLLSDNQVNINERDENGWTPLHCCCSSEKLFNVCKKLVIMGAKVNTMNYHGNTPLHYLAKCRIESPDVISRQIEVLKLMIESGANLDFKNSEGETPLHFAILANNVEFVRCLICSLCNVCAVNNDNESCLHYAVQTGYYQLVEILLESGASYNCTDKHGRTPINLAIQRGNSEVAKLLKRFDAEKQRKRTSCLASYRSVNHNNNNNNNKATQ